MPAGRQEEGVFDRRSNPLLMIEGDCFGLRPRNDKNQTETNLKFATFMDKPDVTTNELMEFLQEHMVMKGELDLRLNKLKLDILDGVDEKLASMKGDLVVMMRNEDKKVMLVVQKLKQKNIFSDQDVEEFVNLLPFPQMTRPV